MLFIFSLPAHANRAGCGEGAKGWLCGNTQDGNTDIWSQRLRGPILDPLLATFDRLRDQSRDILKFREGAYNREVNNHPNTAFKDTYLSNIGIDRWQDRAFGSMRDSIELLRMNGDIDLDIFYLSEAGMDYWDPCGGPAVGCLTENTIFLTARTKERLDFFLSNPMDPEYRGLLTVMVHELTHMAFDDTMSNWWDALSVEETGNERYRKIFYESGVVSEGLAVDQADFANYLLNGPPFDYRSMTANGVMSEDEVMLVGSTVANLYNDPGSGFRPLFDTINPKIEIPSSITPGLFNGSQRAQAWGYRTQDILPLFIPPARGFAP